MTTKVWTCLNGTGAPPAQNVNGTFGRWRYLAEYNAFILVNQPDQNVYFYKHTAGCGCTRDASEQRLDDAEKHSVATRSPRPVNFEVEQRVVAVRS